MQKSNEILLIAMFSTTLLFSCKKNIPQENKVPSPSNHSYKPMSSSTSRPSLSIFEANTMPWEDLGIGYDDVNVGYNKAKLFLSIGLTEVVKDPVISSWIVNEAKRHEDNVFYFEDLFARFPETKKIIESQVDPLGELTGWSFESIQQQMQYEDFNIKASIYLTNTEIVDPSLKPIVTPGYDVIAEDERHPSDVVLGWYINSNNEVSRINLWQEIIEGVTAPIFAIDGRSTNKPPLVIITGQETGSNTAERPTVYLSGRINLADFAIGNRYEASWQGNSEYKITGRCLYFQYSGAVGTYYLNPPSYSWPFLRNDCNSTRKEDMDEISVSPYNVNHWIIIHPNKYFAKILSDPNLETSEYDLYTLQGSSQLGPCRKRLYYNSYENDGWSTSNKTLSPYSINGVYLNLKGHMGTYSEWYQTDPYNISSWLPQNTLKIDNYSDNWEMNRNADYKGGFTKVKRVPGYGCN